MLPPDFFDSASPRAGLQLLKKIDDEEALRRIKRKFEYVIVRDHDIDIIAFFRDAVAEAGIGAEMGDEEMEIIVTMETQ